MPPVVSKYKIGVPVNPTNFLTIATPKFNTAIYHSIRNLAI